MNENEPTTPSAPVKIAEWELVRDGDGHKIAIALLGDPANPHAVVTHGAKDAPPEVFFSGLLQTLMVCVAATHTLLTHLSEEAARDAQRPDSEAPTGAA